jgi:hypothetical protein
MSAELRNEMPDPINRKPAPVPRPPARSGTFRIAGVAVLVVVAAVVVFLALRGSGNSNTSKTTSNVTAVTEAQLATLATSVGHPIFWVGPRAGMTYELTQSSNGNIAIRYLPTGVKLGSASPYLTVATYPFPGAYPALQVVGAQKGATPVTLPNGGFAVISSSQPDNVHAAFPNVDYQAEVFDPTAGAAEKLVAGGDLTPIGNLNAGSATPATATTAANLRSLAKSLGHPIYWAGPKPKDTLELTQTSTGQIYVRYLPKGVAVGTGKPYLTVATYPFKGAFTALQALTTQKGVHKLTLKGGGIGLVDSTDPKSIHVAFPSVDYQIEVFDPAPAAVRKVVTSGHIVSVG